MEQYIGSQQHFEDEVNAYHDALHEFQESQKPDEQIEAFDWNTLTIEQMADHLRKEFQFDSSGTARCIFALLEFYEKNKP
jgi:uncharacterized protein Yka (UPF0111/DUF47 family)